VFSPVLLVWLVGLLFGSSYLLPPMMRIACCCFLLHCLFSPVLVVWLVACSSCLLSPVMRIACCCAAGAVLLGFASS